MSQHAVKTAVRRFPAPLEVATPTGAEGWQEMYSPYLLFSEENANWESSLFWYWDGMHRPDVEYPFDTIVHEAYMLSVSAAVSRIFSIPGSRSAASRVLNGRLYLADIPFADAEESNARVETFVRRAGHYFENWPELSRRWVAKVDALTDELAALRVPQLPELEDESVVAEARGVSAGAELLEAYNRCVDNVFRVYQYHFEMLLLAYVAQMNFQDFARSVLPGLSEQTLMRLTGGVDLEQFRPDEELRRLAHLAVHVGVAGELRADRSPDETIAALRGSGPGREWLAALDAVKDPWFHVSTGTGLFHHERAWVDDLSVPFMAIRGYADRLVRGESIDPGRAERLAERDALTRGYRALLTDESTRAAFDENLELARLVAPHLQDHNFHIEHRHHTVFWNLMRAFADRVVAAGLLDAPDDLFYLSRWEVGQILFDTANSWAQASPGLGRRWRATVARRREIVEALRAWVPEPAVGAVPTELGGMLAAQFGITMETIDRWLEDEEESDRLTGVAASAGAVEGRARVIISPEQLTDVDDGEVLVCPATAPAWAPVFNKIAATVSDVGGAMCHAAILCREYGIPAVLGTGVATRRLRTGDLLRVDGDSGVVTVLSAADGH